MCAQVFNVYFILTYLHIHHHPFTEPVKLSYMYVDKSWRSSEQVTRCVHCYLSSCNGMCVDRCGHITYSLISSRASHLKPPAGGDLPCEQLGGEAPQCAADTWRTDSHLYKTWEAKAWRDRAALSSRLPLRATGAQSCPHVCCQALVGVLLTQPPLRCQGAAISMLIARAPCVPAASSTKLAVTSHPAKKIRTWKFRGVQISLSSLAET